MLSRFVFFVLFSFVIADLEFVRKKLCKDVDSSQCTVNSVVSETCAQGPAFCHFKKNKKYGLTLNLTPHFSALKLKIAMYGDVLNDETYSTVIKSPADACGILTCPLQAEEQRVFDVDVILNKKASGKFPVKVKLWDEEDESKACCFTFTVKVK